METATLGVFLSLDMFLFYVFWEFALVPMYFLIGIWGGERRVYASLKFFIYTMAWQRAHADCDLVSWQQRRHRSILRLDREEQPLRRERVMFLAFAIAFAIKVPLFPSTPGCPMPTSKRRRPAR